MQFVLAHALLIHFLSCSCSFYFHLGVGLLLLFVGDSYNFFEHHTCTERFVESYVIKNSLIS